MSKKETPIESVDVKASLSAEDQSVVDVPQAQPAGRALTDADVVDMSQLYNSDPSAKTQDVATFVVPEGAGTVQSPDKPVAPSDQTSASPEVPSMKKTYRIGNKTFDTPEALAAYVEGFAQQQQDLADQIQAAVVKPKEPEFDYETQWFENPKKTKEALKAEIRAELDAEREADRRKRAEEDRRTSVWSAFYKDNPDLDDWREVVEHQFQETLKTSGTMDIREGLKLIADQARKTVNTRIDKRKPTVELKSGPAITTSARGSEVPRNTEAPQLTNFISEVKGLNKKKA